MTDRSLKHEFLFDLFWKEPLLKERLDLTEVPSAHFVTFIIDLAVYVQGLVMKQHHIVLVLPYFLMKLMVHLRVYFAHVTS